jgi:hypothetical protein
MVNEYGGAHMALKVKKSYPDPNNPGRFIEVEGTEAEIESFEKKQQKKNESATRKKEILHGKAARSLKNADVIEELKKFIAQEVAKITAAREVHHWYFNNGWWWRPWYFNGQTTYLYSTTAPNTAGWETSIISCNSSNELQTATGVVSEVADALTNGNSTIGNYVNTNGLVYGTSGYSYTMDNSQIGNWSCTTTDLSNVGSVKIKPDGSVN